MKDEHISINIKIMGFIMTCCMVLYHTGGIESARVINNFDEICSNYVSYVFEYLGHYAMCHFFSVTGFLLFCNLNMHNYEIKMKRRVTSLLIPYLVWQVIITVKSVIANQYQFSVKDFLARTFLLAERPVDGPLWYVYAVFLMALLSPVFLFIMRNKKVGFMFLVVVCLSLETLDTLEPKLWIQILSYSHNITGIVFYFPCYVIGAFCGKFLDLDNVLDILKYFFYLCLVAFLFEGIFEGFFFWTVVRVLPLVGVTLIPSIPPINDLWIYNLTFLMYAVHGPLISDIKPDFEALLLNINLPITTASILVHLTMLVCDIGIAALLYFILRKLSPKFLEILTGGRGA